MRRLAGYLALAIATGGSLWPSAASSQQAMIEDVSVFYALVESVDPGARTVLLRVPDGLATVQVGPEVKNLAQVKTGDRVRVDLREALVARLTAAGTGVGAPQVEEHTLTALPGEKPASLQSRTVRANVRIQSVDPAANTVQFVGPAGILRTAVVKDPSMQALLRQLKVGDVVEMTYSVAVARRVEPVSK